MNKYFFVYLFAFASKTVAEADDIAVAEHSSWKAKQKASVQPSSAFLTLS